MSGEDTGCERKAWRSSNNKYCCEQYLWYLFSHPQEFFLLCIPKKQQPHKHWSREDSSALAVPSVCDVFFGGGVVSCCRFQCITMNMRSDQKHFSRRGPNPHFWRNKWILCEMMWWGETVLLMEGGRNSKLYSSGKLNWVHCNSLTCCLDVWLLD